MSVATRLEAIELDDTEGTTTRLGDLWRKKPAVLVFVRHFG